MSVRNPRYISGGTIQPSRIVKMDVTKPFTVLQADAANTPLVGVSQEGSMDPPGVVGSATDAARADKTLRVHGPGEECLLEYGAAVATGDFLKPDAVGRGIPVTFGEAAGHRHAAIALEDGVLGTKGRVLVVIGTI